MTILLYDKYELEERSSRHLKAWKAWHLVLYALAAISGIMNYVFLQNTMSLLNGNCVLYPRHLEFHMVDLTENVESRNDLNATSNTNDVTTFKNPTAPDAQSNSSAIQDVPVVNRTQRDVNETTRISETSTEFLNESAAPENQSLLVLDMSRTLFSNECEFAQYMPILSTVFACVWAVMFTMCAGGGRPHNGLQQPWRILAPALLFAAVMVGLTGRSFTDTNGGLHAFCAGFFDITNTTACSAVHQYIELSRASNWSMGGRISAIRAASAGVWASWACIAALLLARCLVAPDFQVKKTGAYLVKDPQKKITSYLKKQRHSRRSNQSSPVKHDTVSVRSEPTITTELVTASVEQGQISLPSSLTATPLPTPRNQELIEMTYSSQERDERHLD